MRRSKARRCWESSRREREFNPSFEDFQRFLEENPYRKFAMEDPHSCVAAVYSDREISETYCGPAWFREVQKKVNHGVWLGKDILAELKRLKPPMLEAKITPRAAHEVRLEHGSFPRQAQRGKKRKR